MALQIKLIQILFCLHRTGWIKTRPVQKLLVRVKFTGNSYSYRTCVNVNGHRWNTRKLVFTGTRIQVPGLVLVWMWTHPKVLSVKCSTFNVTGLYCGCVVFFGSIAMFWVLLLVCPVLFVLLCEIWNNGILDELTSLLQCFDTVYRSVDHTNNRVWTDPIQWIEWSTLFMMKIHVVDNKIRR